MAEVIVVQGGNPVSGTIDIGGAKNSALKLMAATVLATGRFVISNVPDISDVHIMAEVLRRLGAEVSLADHQAIIDTTGLDSFETPYELVVKMRASISVLGPLIGRFGRARVAMPGGCNIGARNLDMHIAGLEHLGVSFSSDHGFIVAETPQGLHGAEVALDFPSVGATENLMMAAVCAEGLTRIENAAREPEIADLATFLNEMGAQISGAGTPVIEIEGVAALHATDHVTCGDRIEAGTYLVAGALMGGPLTVRAIDPAYLTRALDALSRMGVEVTTTADSVTVRRTGALKAADIQTLPHPGFPTDLQAQFMVLSVMADGLSVITENVFENRFLFASEITRMGGDVRIDGHHAFISGTGLLSGAPVVSPDLRGGAALVLAGLAAEGETVVSDIHHIDRGYERFVEKLASVGASVARVEA
jgi:UDP-N-acetylglucosamine 1-carboxyvinyltransferase